MEHHTGLVYLPHSSVTLKGAINKSTYGGSCFVAVVDNLVMKGAADIVPKGGCVRDSLCRRVRPLAGVSW